MHIQESKIEKKMFFSRGVDDTLLERRHRRVRHLCEGHGMMICMMILYIYIYIYIYI